MLKPNSPAAESDFRSLPIAEMEAILTSFEQRTSAAQAASSPSKHWVKRAIRRQGDGRCPVWIKRLSLDIVLRHGEALADLFCRYPDDVDVDLLARQFGGRISFCGAIDLQQMLAYGTPSEIRDTVRHRIETLGRPFGGGFIVAPANVMTPEIPLENLEALFEATHEQAE